MLKKAFFIAASYVLAHIPVFAEQPQPATIPPPICLEQEVEGWFDKPLSPQEFGPAKGFLSDEERKDYWNEWAKVVRIDGSLRPNIESFLHLGVLGVNETDRYFEDKQHPNLPGEIFSHAADFTESVRYMLLDWTFWERAVQEYNLLFVRGWEGNFDYQGKYERFKHDAGQSARHGSFWQFVKEHDVLELRLKISSDVDDFGVKAFGVILGRFTWGHTDVEISFDFGLDENYQFREIDRTYPTTILPTGLSSIPSERSDR